MKTEHLIGIEIGGTKLQIVAGTDDGSITERRRYEVDRSTGGTGIRDRIAEALPQLLNSHSPKAIGVGFGGPVDWRTGRIRCSHHVEGWSQFDLGLWLTEIAALPARIDNDANVAALGESMAGAGRNRDPVFYITIGSGIGGGLISERKIYHGAVPGESEIGHLRINRTGDILESRCSGWSVDRRIRELATNHPHSILAKLLGTPSGGESKHLRKAIDDGDEDALRLLDSVGDDLGFALSHVVHLQHPEAIVVGGGLSLIGQPLVAAITNSLEKYVMEAFRPLPYVESAALGEDAVTVGALLLAGQADVSGLATSPPSKR